MSQICWASAAVLSLGLIGRGFGAEETSRSTEDPLWKARVAPWLRSNLELRPRLQGQGSCLKSDAEMPVLALVPAEEAGGLDIDAARLSDLGCEVLRQTKDIVLARVPLAVLSQVIDDPAVGFVRPPFRPTLFKENAKKAIGADPWHDASHNGSGVKVGVVDIGFLGYRDLFSQIHLTEYTTWHAAGFEFGAAPDDDIHGAACTELLYTMAPGAKYYLAQVGSDTFEADVPAAFDWLRSQGVSVVSMSLGMMAFYYDDGSSPFCAPVNEARAAGAFVCVAAGNEGEGYYWTGDFADADGDGFHEFSSGDSGNDFEVGDLTGGILVLTWDGGERTAEDFDLFIYSKRTGLQVAKSTVRQEGTQPALEIVEFMTAFEQPMAAEDEIFLLDPGQYEVRIRKVQTTSRHGLRLCVWIEDGDGWWFPITRIYPQYFSTARSLSTPADAQGAFAVGAWSTSNARVADYSSRGPTGDGRLKPDLVAPSGLTTVAYAPESFEGTSASTPVCAGAAALLLEAYPELGPDDVEAILEVNAKDKGAAGPDNTAGHGFLSLPPVPPLALFERGNIDGKGPMDISDPIVLLRYLFLGGQPPPCLDAADADDSGALEITDAVRVLSFLFQGGTAPAEPSTGCGNDATEDTLGCESSTCP